MDELEGFKLMRIQNGELHPLFINRSLAILPGRWYVAEDHPTKGYAHRPGWHATLSPVAPHLKMRLASGEQRVWVRVRLRGTTLYDRPESQGGTWVLAEEMKVIGGWLGSSEGTADAVRMVSGIPVTASLLV